MKLKLHNLVLFGTRLGLGFSGGSDATMLYFKHIADHFESVTLVCQTIGFVPFEHQTKIFKTQDEAKEILQALSKGQNMIFYGDFLDAHIYIELDLPFYFTYHDTWQVDDQNQQSNPTVMRYQNIFKNAKHVFTVSDWALSQIQKFTNDCSLTKCGPQIEAKMEQKRDVKSNAFLMVGNIDERKYGFAVSLFEALAKKNWQGSIDIYGNINDFELSNRLEGFSFVKVKGFQTSIPYCEYAGLISTSQAENLPISMIEAKWHELPILSFDVGGIKEIVKSEGIMVEKGDVLSLANAILESEVNQMDSSKIEEMKTYSWANSAQHMLDIMGIQPL